MPCQRPGRRRGIQPSRVRLGGHLLITILARRLARRVRGGPGVPVAKPVASTACRDRVRATHPRSAALGRACERYGGAHTSPSRRSGRWYGQPSVLVVRSARRLMTSVPKAERRRDRSRQLAGQVHDVGSRGPSSSVLHRSNYRRPPRCRPGCRSAPATGAQHQTWVAPLSRPYPVMSSLFWPNEHW